MAQPAPPSPVSTHLRPSTSTLHDSSIGLAVMQTAASRRAFSFLASKIHPQLPLSPRESLQLLTLLTTSFRTHLDREHPTSSPENDNRQSLKAKKYQKFRRQSASASSSIQSISSHTSATEHIDSILTNPLFAVQPKSRESDLTKLHASSVLKDPLGWFVNHEASGTATLPKAVACLRMIVALSKANPETAQVFWETRRPASHIAKWLETSGLDRSGQFVQSEPNNFLYPMVELLLQEDQAHVVWQWITRSLQQRETETGLEAAKIRAFRAHLLRSMVKAKLEYGLHDEALSIFLQACKLCSASSFDLDNKSLKSSASIICNSIILHPVAVRNPKLYEAFLQSSSTWTEWGGIHALLWLHHPTAPSALHAIAFIKNSQPLVVNPDTTYKTKLRKLHVHICLETARQCLSAQNFGDAQYALEFARDNFPELVGSVHQKSTNQVQFRKVETVDHKEDRYLEMLDKLLPV